MTVKIFYLALLDCPILLAGEIPTLGIPILKYLNLSISNTTVKNVTYYLAESSYDTPKIEEDGGLTDAKWWDINNLGDIKIYRDVNKVIVTAIAAIPSIDTDNTNQNNIN